VLEQAAAGGEMARRIRDRTFENLAALIAVTVGPNTLLFAAGGLTPPLHALLFKKTKRPILKSNANALTGCWLVATEQAPEEHALLFG
jgi:hypothetical protein